MTYVDVIRLEPDGSVYCCWASGEKNMYGHDTWESNYIFSREEVEKRLGYALPDTEDDLWIRIDPWEINGERQMTNDDHGTIDNPAFTKPMGYTNLTDQIVDAGDESPFADCPVCGSAQVVRLAGDWQQQEVAIPIIGCGNPWHYATSSMGDSGVVLAESSLRPSSYPAGEWDARLWAAEFKRIFPDTVPDEGTMLGWFANAILTGYDYAKREGTNG